MLILNIIPKDKAGYCIGFCSNNYPMSNLLFFYFYQPVRIWQGFPGSAPNALKKDPPSPPSPPLLFITVGNSRVQSAYHPGTVCLPSPLSLHWGEWGANQFPVGSERPGLGLQPLLKLISRAVFWLRPPCLLTSASIWRSPAFTRILSRRSSISCFTEVDLLIFLDFY